MLADNSSGDEPKRPLGSIYKQSELRAWAKYWNCSQQNIRDAAKVSGAMVVDIQDWLTVNVPHWVAPRRVPDRRLSRPARHSSRPTSRANWLGRAR